jgi:Trypsin-like peptidase domain
MTYVNRTLLALVMVLAQASAPSAADHKLDINTALIQSTFRIQGASKEPNGLTMGTGIVVGRSCGEPAPGKAAYTLVTAAHVLQQISGDTLHILARLNLDGTWIKNICSVKIRDQNGELWKKHPDVDIAAMYIQLPEGAVPILLSTDFFATDHTLEQLEVRSGDRVQAMGFPLGVEANASGFPILRSGRIASFPLLPQSRTKTFLVHMDAFSGDSGGPVYLLSHNRQDKGAAQGDEVRLFMGIVTSNISSTIAPQTRLPFTEAVHANFVLETIEMLPPPQCAK